MRSSSAVFERLPRDNSSKSLVVSIEDVSKNLEANDDNVSNKLKTIKITKLFFKLNEKLVVVNFMK